jgi:hypothetical protein
MLIELLLLASLDSQCQPKKKSTKVCYNVEETKPKVVTKIVYRDRWRTKWRTKWKTKIVEKKVPVYVKEPCCDKKGNSVSQNQKVIIKLDKKTKRRVVKVIKYKTKVKYKKVKVNNKNRLQILIGKSKTEQEIIKKNCCDVTGVNNHEVDFGLQYIRDFGNLSISLSGTTNENYYIGFGVNW